MKHSSGSVQKIMNAKIIPFPVQKQEPEDNYGSMIHDLLKQQFPENTWHRLQFDLLTKNRAKIFLNGRLKHLDEGRRLKFVIQALTPEFGKRTARYLAQEILFSEKPAFIR